MVFIWSIASRIFGFRSAKQLSWSLSGMTSFISLFSASCTVRAIYKRFDDDIICYDFKLTFQSIDINRIHDGLFRGCSRMGGTKAPLPKICHTYPTMMKLGTVIPYLKKIQKLYKSSDTLLDFCWHQHFVIDKQQILLYQEIQI